MILWNRFWIPILVSLAVAGTIPDSAYSQGPQSPGAYTDVKELPQSPAGQRMQELLNVLNSGDSAQAKEFIVNTLAPQFRDALPMGEHLDTFARVRRESGGLDFYAIRHYEAARPTNEIVAIVRRKLTGDWLGIILEVEAAEPRRVAKLSFAPARPPSDLPPEGALNQQELVAELGRYLDRLSQADAFSGTVLLAKDGQVLFQHAYGLADKNFDVPNKVDTKFNLGSMNKMFTAVAIAQLAERGQLDFDDPVSKYLGTDWLPKEVADKITLYHLLTHTSGLGSYFNDQFMAASRERFRTVDDYKPLVEPTPAFEPGTQWAYSNTGFLLLGAVIEKVTQQSYFDYVRKNIYAPAGMPNTDAYDMDRVVPNLAIGYSRVSGENGEAWENNLFKHVIRGGPAGGGFSTVEDLLNFDRALRAHKLLKQESTDRLWTPTPQSASGMSYGCGFGVQSDSGDRVVGHNGGFPGISSVLQMHLGSGFTVAVLSNYDNAAPQVEQKLLRLVARL
jgi:CubicO group peptidase (beta-lactamase class C family)